MIIFCLGSPEVKGIRGSDKRKFILDLARLSPRDPNWIGEEDEYLCCLIRPEIISHYINAKNLQYAKEQIQQEIQEKDKKEEAQKSEGDQSSTQISETKPEGEEEAKKGLSYADYLNKLQEYFTQGDSKVKTRFNSNLYTRVKQANESSEKIEGNMILCIRKT